MFGIMKVIETWPFKIGQVERTMLMKLNVHFARSDIFSLSLLTSKSINEERIVKLYRSNSPKNVTKNEIWFILEMI